MNTALWIVQSLLAVMIFAIGFAKTFLPERRLSKLGLTAHSSLGMVRFIGFSELLIGAGLVLPWLMGIMPVLTSIAALALCVVMVLAIGLHVKQNATKKIGMNVIILLLAAFVAWGRFMPLQ